MLALSPINPSPQDHSRPQICARPSTQWRSKRRSESFLFSVPTTVGEEFNDRVLRCVLVEFGGAVASRSDEMILSTAPDKRFSRGGSQSVAIKRKSLHRDCFASLNSRSVRLEFLSTGVISALPRRGTRINACSEESEGKHRECRGNGDFLRPAENTVVVVCLRRRSSSRKRRDAYSRRVLRCRVVSVPPRWDHRMLSATWNVAVGTKYK